MILDRPAYPSDVSDEEWALVVPYLAPLRESSGQRDHELREVFNGLRYIVKTGAPHVTPADADDRGEVGRLAAEVQAETGGRVETAFVDQGYTGAGRGRRSGTRDRSGGRQSP